MGFKDIANGGVADVVADVRQRTADTVVAPRWVLFGELHGKVDDDLPHPRLRKGVRYRFSVLYSIRQRKEFQTPAYPQKRI